MDWIRRNWPDLLIGIALVAVIAGIIATLLTGGSFFPLGASQASSSRLEESSTRNIDPPEVAPTVASTSASEASGTHASDPRATDSQPSAKPEPTARPVTAQEQNQPVAVSALPLPGSTTQADAANRPDSQPTTSVAEQSPAAPSVQLPDPEEAGTYRISVGAFTGEDNAARQADTFREAGYPVFIGTQGALSIVLVGPYEELAEAERVAERIRNGGFRIEPVIYRFQADSESDSSAVGSSPRVTPTPTPQPTASQATAGRFLQVGAYASRESSLPQRERLEGLGFRVSERVEGKLVKLLVGPFEGSELSDARALLNEQGIDHFPR